MNHNVKLKIPKIFLHQSNKKKEDHQSSYHPNEEVGTKKVTKATLNEAPSRSESDGVTTTKTTIARKNKTTKDKKKKKKQVNNSSSIDKESTKQKSSSDEGTVTTRGTKTTAAETIEDRSSKISTRKDGDEEDESTSISGILTMVKDHDRYRHGYDNDKDDHHSYENTYDDRGDGGQYSSDDDGLNKTTTSMTDPKRYLSSYTETLVQRETTLGRYNYLTAESYKELGEIYLQLSMLLPRRRSGQG